MTFILLHAGVPIGRLHLDEGEPAAGSLAPLPAYESVAGPLRREGDLLWRRRAPSVASGRSFALDARSVVATPASSDERVCREADIVREHLELATEDGQQVPVAWIDVADAAAQAEPPFVLVYFRDAPAGVPARVARRRPIGGANAGPPAA